MIKWQMFKFLTNPLHLLSFQVSMKYNYVNKTSKLIFPDGHFLCLVSNGNWFGVTTAHPVLSGLQGREPSLHGRATYTSLRDVSDLVVRLE